jgi:hypothetical protein
VAHNQILIIVLSISGAPSDERSGLSFFYSPELFQFSSVNLLLALVSYLYSPSAGATATQKAAHLTLALGLLLALSVLRALGPLLLVRGIGLGRFLPFLAAPRLYFSIALGRTAPLPATAGNGD